MFKDLAIIATNSILPISRLETAIETCHLNQPLEDLPAVGIDEAKSIYGEWTRKLMSKYRMLLQYPFSIREKASRDASAQEIAACDSVLHELTNVEGEQREETKEAIKEDLIKFITAINDKSAKILKNSANGDTDECELNRRKIYEKIK